MEEKAKFVSSVWKPKRSKLKNALAMDNLLIKLYPRRNAISAS